MCGGNAGTADTLSVGLKDSTDCLSSLRPADMLDSFNFRTSSLEEMSDKSSSVDSEGV